MSHFDGETEEKIKALAAQGFGLREIARSIGSNPGIVHRAFERLGLAIEKRDRSEPLVPASKSDLQIKALAKQGRSQSDIARILKVSRTTVAKALKAEEKSEVAPPIEVGESSKRSRPASPPLAGSTPKWADPSGLVLPDKPTLQDRYEYILHLGDLAAREYEQNPSTSVATQIKMLGERAAKLEASLVAEKLRLEEQNGVASIPDLFDQWRRLYEERKASGDVIETPEGARSSKAPK